MNCYFCNNLLYKKYTFTYKKNPFDCFVCKNKCHEATYCVYENKIQIVVGIESQGEKFFIKQIKFYENNNYQYFIKKYDGFSLIKTLDFESEYDIHHIMSNFDTIMCFQ